MHLVDKDSPYGSELSGKVNMKSLEEQLAHLQGYNAFKLPYVPNPYDKDCPDKGICTIVMKKVGNKQ